jgi:hypothetical protein
MWVSTGYWIPQNNDLYFKVVEATMCYELCDVRELYFETWRCTLSGDEKTHVKVQEVKRSLQPGMEPNSFKFICGAFLLEDCLFINFTRLIQNILTTLYHSRGHIWEVKESNLSEFGQWLAKMTQVSHDATTSNQIWDKIWTEIAGASQLISWFAA